MNVSRSAVSGWHARDALGCCKPVNLSFGVCRILATRGCSVVRLRVSKGISAGQSSTFLSWWMLCSQRGPVFSEHPGTVAITEALLQSVAAETEGQLHPFARAAAATGSLRLWVDTWLALEAQKQGWTLCHAMIQGNLLRKAVTEFQWALARRDPSLSTWVGALLALLCMHVVRWPGTLWRAIALARQATVT